MSDKYTMKIPQKLADFFQRYIDDHPELGYNFISQYFLHIIQEEAKKILSLEKIRNEKPVKIIELEKGRYNKEDLLKFLENMEK